MGSISSLNGEASASSLNGEIMEHNHHMYTLSRVMRKPGFLHVGKTKVQISFTITAKLISVFVFATLIVQFLFYLNSKFQASSFLLSLCRQVCVGRGRKP